MPEQAPNKKVVIPEKYTTDMVKQAMLILEGYKTRQAKTKAYDQSPEAKEKNKVYNKRRRFKQELLCAKALAQGIVITDDDIADELKRRQGG